MLSHFYLFLLRIEGHLDMSLDVSIKKDMKGAIVSCIEACLHMNMGKDMKGAIDVIRDV